MPSQADELRASIHELEALLHDADPQMRGILQQQIAALHSGIALLASVQPGIDSMKQQRAPVPETLRAMFTPQPPAEVPAWLRDDMMRERLGERDLRCPPGAKVYWSDNGAGCAIPTDPPGSIPIRNGLELRFHATGRLAAQQFYEHGLLRWAISYHASGGRYQVGFYSATERLTYPQHGLHTSYAPNGTVTLQETYVYGKKHGWSIHWEDDGYPIGATRYAEDVAAESYTPDGRHQSL